MTAVAYSSELNVIITFNILNQRHKLGREHKSCMSIRAATVSQLVSQ